MQTPVDNDRLREISEKVDVAAGRAATCAHVKSLGPGPKTVSANAGKDSYCE